MRKMIYIMLIFLNSCFNLTAPKGSNQIQLISKPQTITENKDKALHFFSQRSDVIRFSEIEVNQAVKSANLVREGDKMRFLFFGDLEYSAIIERINHDINGTVAITAKLMNYDYAYAIFTATSNRLLVNILIPEINRFYQILSDPDSLDHYLVEMDAEDRDILEGSAPL